MKAQEKSAAGIRGNIINMASVASSIKGRKSRQLTRFLLFLTLLLFQSVLTGRPSFVVFLLLISLIDIPSQVFALVSDRPVFSKCLTGRASFVLVLLLSLSPLFFYWKCSQIPATLHLRVHAHTHTHTHTHIHMIRQASCCCSAYLCGVIKSITCISCRPCLSFGTSFSFWHAHTVTSD